MGGVKKMDYVTLEIIVDRNGPRYFLQTSASAKRAITKQDGERIGFWVDDWDSLKSVLFAMDL